MDNRSFVERWLGKQTRWVCAAPDQGTGAIIRMEKTLYEELCETMPPIKALRAKMDIMENSPERCTRPLGWDTLTESRPLTSTMLATLANLVLDDASYNRRKHQRPLPIFNFVFQIARESKSLDILVDLYNPAWKMIEDGRTPTSWVNSPAIRQIRDIAKGLFPEYASSIVEWVWRKEVMAKFNIEDPWRGSSSGK